MSNLINFELVSPEAKLVSEPMYLVEVPGDDGTFGVAAGHCSLVSSLRSGVVRLRKDENSDEVQEIFIAGGFADVTAESCTILAEQAINVKDINLESLEQYLTDLTEDLSLAEEVEDKARINNKISLVKAKISAVTA
ncbi:MAG: ATP synthase F1 subunit epsilon [Alphaproteobacteria bacterium]